MGVQVHRGQVSKAAKKRPTRHGQNRANKESIQSRGHYRVDREPSESHQRVNRDPIENQ
jgi:hypothetical protein